MTPPLLAVRELAVDYGKVRAVRGVSLEVRAGEVVGIVGESGSGKTTLALAVLGLLPASARLRSGEIRWKGEDLLAASAERRRALRGREIAMIFQEPLSALHPAFPVVSQIAEALRAHRPGLDRRAARSEAVERLEAVGIPQPARRTREVPHQWSGGMRQRVLIAMALAHDPSLLIADEPTTALDVTVQARIIELLRRKAPAAAERDDAASGGTLVITHDFGLVAELADRVLVMQDGRVVEAGTATRIFDRPSHPHTRALLDARPGTGAITGRSRTGGAHAAPRERSSDVDASTNDDDIALEAVNLYASYGPTSRGGDPVVAVRDVSFRLRAGEALGLVGESGSGKSSLARALVGLLPATGRIRVGGRPVPPTTRRSRSERRALQIVFQDPFGSLNPRRSAGDAIAEALRIHSLDADRRQERVAELLGLVELDASFGARFPTELSGGERQRVAIARALACRPEVLVLDEPVTSLDLPVQVRILALLERLCRELRTALLLIAHDLRMVRDVADRVAVMHDGRLIETGRTEDVFERPSHPETRRLLDAIPAHHPSQRANRLASSR